jgi:hypothetical protein
LGFQSVSGTQILNSEPQWVVNLSEWNGFRIKSLTKGSHLLSLIVFDLYIPTSPDIRYIFDNAATLFPGEAAANIVIKKKEKSLGLGSISSRNNGIIRILV